MTSSGTTSISEQIQQQFVWCAKEGSGGEGKRVSLEMWRQRQAFYAQTVSGWKVGFLTKPNWFQKVTDSCGDTRSHFQLKFLGRKKLESFDEKSALRNKILPVAISLLIQYCYSWLVFPKLSYILMENWIHFTKLLLFISKFLLVQTVELLTKTFQINHPF